MRDHDPIRAAREELADPAVPRSTDAAVGEQAGDQLGRYRLLEQIGEGGMGSVWLASQSEPVRRRVALKIVKLGMDTREVIARFEAERQALALMEHPNIARVLDGGATEAGRPYFVMELVRGLPITEHCTRAMLGLRDRLALFVKVCDAIQHAHQKGVIHRDIKASNVLVTMRDGEAVPKVIDFGIAKAINVELTQKTLFTQFAQIIGTPESMAPEQASLSGLDVDTRADVYALGVLLYELLTGTRPFDLRTARSETYEELLRTIREVDPERPSTRVSTLRAKTSRLAVPSFVDSGDLARRLAGDLDSIVMKALEKDRERRYMTATGFAEDVGRFLADEPVLAVPQSAAYRLRKAARRHRRVFVASGVALALLVGGIVGTATGLVRAVRARGEADEARLEAERVTTFTGELFAGLAPRVAAGRDTRVLRHMMDGAATDLIADGLVLAPQSELALRQQIGETYRQLGAFDDARRMLVPALELARRISSPPSEAVATALQTLGMVEVELEDVESASARYEEALAIWRQLPQTEGHTLSIANASNDLALVERRAGNLDRALELAETAVQLKRALFPDGDTSLAASLGILASVRKERGERDASEAAYLEALATARGLVPPDASALTYALANVAILRSEQGRFDEAEALARDALTAAQGIYEGDHAALAGAHGRLGRVLQARGEPRRALPEYKRALEIFERAYPEGHSQRLEGAYQYALALSAADRNREAEALTRRTLATALRDCPDNAALVAAVRGAHGRILSELGRIVEAREVLSEAVEAQRTTTSIDRFELGVALVGLAGVRLREGDAEGAERDLREAIALYRSLNGPESALDLANALDNLGNTLLVLERQEEAEALLRECIALKREILPAHHEDLATSLQSLANAVATRGEQGEALALAAEALEIRRQIFAPGDSALLRSHLQLAALALEGGDEAAGVEHLEAVLQAAATEDPARATLVVEAAGRMAGVALGRSDLERAAECTALALEVLGRTDGASDELLGAAYTNSGYVAMLSKDTARALEHYSLAVEHFLRLPKLGAPSAVFAANSLAMAALQSGDFPRAARAFADVERLADRSVAVPANVLFDALQSRSVLLARLGETEDRVRLAERMLTLAEAAYPGRVELTSAPHGLLAMALISEARAAATRGADDAVRTSLARAEESARECLRVREEALADSRNFAWTILDASSVLGEVLLASAQLVDPTGPEDPRLTEARERIEASAAAQWSDTWTGGRRPPTSPEAAQRVVLLREYSSHLEPDAGHESELPTWRERAASWRR
ncbi:MAG: tetratricopeptide repeat protein [Planctomycetota bacterium]